MPLLCANVMSLSSPTLPSCQHTLPCTRRFMPTANTAMPNPKMPCHYARHVTPFAIQCPFPCPAKPPPMPTANLTHRVMNCSSTPSSCPPPPIVEGIGPSRLPLARELVPVPPQTCAHDHTWVQVPLPISILLHRRSNALTPYHPDTWLSRLMTFNLLKRYPTLYHSLVHGFDVGILSISKTCPS